MYVKTPVLGSNQRTRPIIHQLGLVISISWVTTAFWYQEVSFYLEKIKYLRIYSSHGDLITVNLKVAYIPGRDTSIFGKDYTNGSVMYVCLSVVSRKNWQYLQSLVVRIPVSNPSEKAYSLVENAKKWEIGCLSIHRCTIPLFS